MLCSTRINFRFLFCRVLATEEDNFVSYERYYNRRIKFVAPAHAKRVLYFGTIRLLTGAKIYPLSKLGGLVIHNRAEAAATDVGVRTRGDCDGRSESWIFGTENSAGGRRERRAGARSACRSAV